MSTGKVLVRRAGRGPAVLLLHGFPETGVAWRKISTITLSNAPRLPAVPSFAIERVGQEGDEQSREILATGRLGTGPITVR